MRIVFAVLLFTIALVASYPSYRETATEDEDNALELEVRSILNYLNEERSVNEDEDEEEEYEVSKRQGGRNVVDKQSKCEIECIYKQRNPAKGKGKSVKDAAKTCRTLCPVQNKKRGPNKPAVKPKSKREYDEDESESSDEQQVQRRELYNYLMTQLEEDNE